MHPKLKWFYDHAHDPRKPYQKPHWRLNYIGDATGYSHYIMGCHRCRVDKLIRKAHEEEDVVEWQWERVGHVDRRICPDCVPKADPKDLRAFSLVLSLLEKLAS